ncbi:hypothetical protein K0C01_11135 [Salinarchaeum sp. IM2453]|uniref:DUF5805 domain-containing protein n=1 Tax=Salinarchaeum sp. IM2453 TaxID=2862870 RepID=UPI001C83EAB4|nr:DUF5805 domain-containing protein [Salinarchaeum sp. IM2453]QZA88324.1 hypothetical protein K0C01_11135 [Salinarchaeum sp. IM2453]
MSGGSDRSVVKTYVSAEQKSTWKDHASELDMTLSEFVRTMVQAGHRGISIDAEELDSSDDNPGGDDLETVVLDSLRESPKSFDELHDELTEGIDTRLEETLEQLQEQNQIKYAPRKGYTLNRM